jgi:hypothetical protein
VLRRRRLLHSSVGLVRALKSKRVAALSLGFSHSGTAGIREEGASLRQGPADLYGRRNGELVAVASRAPSFAAVRRRCARSHTSVVPPDRSEFIDNGLAESLLLDRSSGPCSSGVEARSNAERRHRYPHDSAHGLRPRSRGTISLQHPAAGVCQLIWPAAYR